MERNWVREPGVPCRKTSGKPSSGPVTSTSSRRPSGRSMWVMLRILPHPQASHYGHSMTGIHCGSVSREYPQVLARAGRIASGLAAAGVGAGDRVAIYLHNDVIAIEASIGTGILGATPVPVNWHWKGAELAYLLDDSASRVVFAHTDLVPTAEAVAGDRLLVEVAGPDGPATGRHPVFEEWLAGHDVWS